MNRLAGEPSAYLRQHAHQPVAWYPYGDAAFAQAQARDVPIFLSVGYAACHWCHVMAQESFDDPAIAAYLNEHFVSIKVDREERPDVDDSYMAATQALSGQGGWPMSVFATPDGRAFYAGTYFAPVPGPGRPSFQQVLTAVTEAWRERREQVLATAESLSQTLAQPVWPVQAAPNAGIELSTEARIPWREPLAQAFAALAASEDAVHGGLGQAPKFPPTPGLEFLMRLAASGHEPAAGPLAGRSLAAMVHSALFDQLGGGFARYSVTADWSEPHYEKMLYDNAGLLQGLVHWIRLADSAADMFDGGRSPSGISPLSAADARDAARATFAWLMREMRLPGGAFASSLDADTVIDGVHFEGASYTWTAAELLEAATDTLADPAAAGELAAAVARFMGLPAEGAHPLHPGRALTAAQRTQWELLKPALLQRRARRVMPARDEKVVAAWNAMLLQALAEGAMVLGEPAWLSAARELGDYLQGVHWDGTLTRVSHGGKARGIKGLLEDYAACARAFLALYAATGERAHFELAAELLTAAEREFILDGVLHNLGGHSGADGAAPGAPTPSTTALTARHADPFDNATAGAVSLLAEAMLAYSGYTGSTRHADMALAMLATVPDAARRAPRAAGGVLGTAVAVAHGPREVAIVGPAGPQRDRLVRAAWSCAEPGLVIAVWDGVGVPPVPLFEGRSLAERGTAAPPGPLAYLCRRMACARPVSTPAELLALLR